MKMSIERIELLGVPVDVCTKKDFEEKVIELLESEKVSQVIFLSVWDLLKARKKKKEYSKCVQEADLVVPVSKSIIWAAKVLKKTVPQRFNPFTTLISVMNILDARYKSIYLLGGKKVSITLAEKNVRSTFKGLHIVGRYIGAYQKAAEDAVVQAVFKSSPSFVLLSDGLRDKVCWLHNRRDKFGTGLFLYYRDALDIFSNRIKKVNDRVFERGLEVWIEILRNPIRIFRFIPFLYYVALVVCTRLFKR